MEQAKIVLCGKCGRRIATVNPKIKTIQVFNCRNCWKENIYNPMTDTTVVKDIPPRNTSSGMTFV